MFGAAQRLALPYPALSERAYGVLDLGVPVDAALWGVNANQPHPRPSPQRHRRTTPPRRHPYAALLRYSHIIAGSFVCSIVSD